MNNLAARMISSRSSHKLHQVQRHLYRQMIRILASSYLALWYVAGWRIEQEMPDLEKYVVLAVPHTSNWDFLTMMAALLVKGRVPQITMKQELFRWPLSWILYLMGAIPIDRKQPKALVQNMAAQIKASDSIIIAFTPEGTRKKTDHWKSGFYYTAHLAQIPIVCGYVDYRRKRVGAGLVLYPTGNIQDDFEHIRMFYELHGAAKYPEQVSNLLLKTDSYEVDHLTTLQETA